MKKMVAVLLALMMLLCVASCSAQSKKEAASTSNQTENEDAPVVKAAVLKGPTAIGMVSLMEKAKNQKTETDYEFTVATAPDQVTAALLKGDLDIACLPTNTAAILYAKSEGKIQICGINTLGVLYLLEKGKSVNALTDLRGKKIIASGKGSTPQYVLEQLLASAGLTVGTDVTVEYAGEHAEALTKFMAGGYDLVLLPQPFVTTAIAKSETVRIALDCNELWEKANQGLELVMGCMVVRTEFAKEHADVVKQFLNDYAASATFATAQVAETAGLCQSFGIMDENLAKLAIPKCAITCIVGKKMKETAENYLKVLYAKNPDSVGGSLPGEDFYWIAG